MSTKKTLQEFVKHKLATDRQWVIKAVQTVLKSQTSHEKALGETIEHNKVGFTAFDAEILTSIGDRAGNGWLSNRQIALLHRVMPKYWAQIVEASKKAGLIQILEKQADQWKEGVVQK